MNSMGAHIRYPLNSGWYNVGIGAAVYQPLGCDRLTNMGNHEASILPSLDGDCT
jgi:hypothetical protein